MTARPAPIALALLVAALIWLGLAMVLSGPRSAVALTPGAQGELLRGADAAAAVAAGEVTGDGLTDIVFGEEAGGINVFTSRLGPPPDPLPNVETRFSSGDGLVLHDLALGDLTGDGILDAVVAGSWDGVGRAEPLRLLTGLGGGQFAVQPNAFGLTGSQEAFRAVAIGDVLAGPGLEVAAGGPGVRVFAATGADPSFAEVARGLDGAAIGSLALGQLGGDGRADIAAAGSANAWVFLGGDQLSPPEPVPGADAFRPAAVRVAALDADGLDDLILLSELAAGDASAAVMVRPTARPVPAPLDTGIRAELLAAGDVSGDGRADVVVASRGRVDNDPATPEPEAALRILFGEPRSQLFSAPVEVPLVVPEEGVHLTPSDLALGDTNADGILDVIVASAEQESQHTIFRGDRYPPPLAEDPSVNSACLGRRPTITGTAGPDRLRGTAGADVISAGSGNDVILGAAGADRICAGPGRDDVSGGAGADLVLGGSGPDRLSGNGGRDSLGGGLGNDRIAGGAGRDRADGGPGRDSCATELRRACER